MFLNVNLHQSLYYTVMGKLYEIWVPKRDQLGYRARYDITTMDSKRMGCEIPIRLS